MTKKFFVFFLALCLMCLASAANATEIFKNFTANDVKYEVSYDIVGDITEININDPIAGGNFQAKHQIEFSLCGSWGDD